MTIAIVLAAAFVSLTWARPPERLGWTPISTPAAAAVAACEGPLYNTYNDGGVLIWFVPSVRVFIDNRQDPYAMPLLAASHALELSGNYEPLFSQYRIRCAALPSESLTVLRLPKRPRVEGLIRRRFLDRS